MKKLIIATVVALTSFGASAECWVVDNLQGQSQFGPSYSIQKDKAEGVYYVNISKNKASLSSSDSSYHSGLTYTPTSAISMIGKSDASPLTETWTITPDGKAIYTKVRVSKSGESQLSSFIGNVKASC